MKNNLPKKNNKIHLYFSIVLFISVITFSSSIPISPKRSKSSPLVKAAVISTPPLPVSKNLKVPTNTAKSVYILDINSGVVLYAKNPNQRLQPASLTKIMTAVVAMDYYNEDNLLSVKNGAKSLGSSAELKSGDVLKSQDLLYALMVPSGNDAAVTLAENYPGGYYAFVSKMNDVFRNLGLQNSHFSNVSGVESANHYTSAYDIAQVAVYALKRPEFRNIVSTKKITLKSEKGYLYPLESTNQLLGQSGVLGVKTGWTPGAGECLVTYVNKNGHPIVISLLGSQDRFGETRSLINWVYSNYNWL